MDNVLNPIHTNLKTDKSRIWNNPIEGCMKLNCDGAYLLAVRVASSGVVIRGNSGSFVRAYLEGWGTIQF
ncbi:hypothetical protein HKD37_09G026090 [Glycine soja]